MFDDRQGDALYELARLAGIQTEYWDVNGGHHLATVEGLLAVLQVLGVAVHGPDDLGAARASFVASTRREVESPCVVWGDRPAVVRLDPSVPWAAKLEVVLTVENGPDRRWVIDTATLVDSTFELPGPLPVGYHVLGVGSGAEQYVADVLVAPEQVVRLGRTDRLWGVFAPAYSLPGGTGLGAHVGDLGRLAVAMDGAGAKVVGTLPLLAAWMGEPFDPSPYAPVSARFWNELYVDLAALPELASVPAARENLTGLRSVGHAANVKGRTFDYRHQYSYVRGMLESVLAARDDWSPGLRDAYARYLEQHPDVVDFARFRAFSEAQRSGWHAWPEPQRSGTIADGDVDPAVVDLHAFSQYAMQRDLDALGTALRARGQRLYLDLPVGAHGDGYDTWLRGDLFAWGAAAGAPPDEFFTAGQNWGFPPLLPHNRWSSHLFHFRDVLRHHMAVAGILRLDHVMGLHRLFWVPDGMHARDGVYVRYPREQFMAVLAIESHRHDCVVVGEDLGTVPDEVRDAMDEHGLLGMYVAEFSQPAWAGAPLTAPDAEQLASIDTHDTPTFSAWLHGFDIDRRHEMGLVSDDDAELERAERRQQVENLTGFLRVRGDLPPGTADAHELDDAVLLEGILRFLGDSDAPVVLLSLDDLVGQTNPQNVPGTMVDRPNWVQRLPKTVDELVTDGPIAALFDAVQSCRLGSHLRAADPRPGAPHA